MTQPGAALENRSPSQARTHERQAVTLEIGKMTISLRTTEAAFLRMLESRYCGFVNAETRAQFVFDVEIGSPEATAGDNDIRVSQECGTWRAERGDFSASWDAGTQEGWIRQSVNPYSADTLLRVVHSIDLAAKGGFLLHAASAIRNGRAFLLAGVSGAGKTTLARLAPHDVTLLTDEISCVVRDKSGFRAYGTPFTGELTRLGENTSAPVGELLLLEKGRDNRLEPMAPAAAVRGLLRNILFLAQEEELVRGVFHSAVEFVSAVSTRRMMFTPDARAWELIR